MRLEIFNYFLSYFLASPQPNCSMVTHAMIAPTIKERWEIENDGFVYIRYNLFDTSMTKTHYPTNTPTGEYREVVESLIKQGLDEWSQATSRKIFIFTETQNPLMANLHFYLTPPYDFPSDVGAETFRQSHSGIINDVKVYYPDDETLWLNTYHDALKYIPMSSVLLGQNDLMNTILHEQGHALGLNLDAIFNSSKAVYKVLNEIPYGKFCSVMPYASNITSPSSWCFACDPASEQSSLGSLDIRMINQAYSLSLPHPTTHYNMMIYNIASPVAHHFLNSVLLALSYPSNNHHLLSNNKAILISDLALLMASSTLGASYFAYALYFLTIILIQLKSRVLPHQCLPASLQDSKHYPKLTFMLEALRLAPLAFYIGVGLSVNLIANSSGKTIANIATTIAENTLGSVVGHSLGFFAAKSINSGIKKSYDRLHAAGEQKTNKKVASQDRTNEKGPLLV